MKKQAEKDLQAKKKPETDFLFNRQKYYILIAGLVITALGFILMIGGGSKDPNEFSYELFDFRRLTIAPFLVLLGYGVMIYSILSRKK
ncbi:MAG: DUF3098 domain-containing protein [Bacteroidales bacterium]